MDLLEFSDIPNISNVSIYWTDGKEFHETRSNGKIRKSDLVRLLKNFNGELISIRFKCFGNIEVDSDGETETFISRDDNKETGFEEEGQFPRLWIERGSLDKNESSKGNWKSEVQLFRSRKMA